MDEARMVPGSTTHQAQSSDAPAPSSEGLPALVVDSVAHRLLEAKLLERLVGGDEAREVRVDRFVIERALGAGGMGTIYAAWDEALRRRVALKFLRRVGTDPAGEERLHREAQALAQLSHPNVVAVHQVGRHEGRVWLAMEHVAGQTLRAWAEQAPRSEAELLRAWMAAGRGLAAIHAAGLVHRDIKPDNVMIGDDGRVRIVDFGLVRLADASQPGASEAGLATVAEWSEGLTAHDGFVGTPAYAAPEQVEGGVIDARSDQFSFCVSLWEALAGKRPLRERRADGQPVLRKGERLPKRIHRALARGLMLSPPRRWDDMDGLLAALEPPRRRWLVPGVVGSGAAVVGLAAGMMVLGEPAAVQEDPCVHAGDRLAEVWSAEQLAPLSATLPAPAVARARALLDAWAAGWQHVARQACEDVHVRQLRSPESLDRRGVCLDRRLADLAALGAEVAAERITDEGQLVAWIGHLDDPEGCLAQAVLTSAIEAPPGEHVEEIARVRRALARVQLESNQRSLADRIAQAEALLARARALGWVPLVGEVTLTLGHLHTIAGSGPAARRHLGEALDISEHGHDLEQQARSWSALNRVERLVGLDSERARWAAQRHEGTFMGFQPTARQRARFLADRGMTEELAGEVDDAERWLREALALLEREDGTTAWEQATVSRNLGNLLAYTGRAAEGRALLERARDLELGFAAEMVPDRPASDLASHGLDEGIALIADGAYQAAATKLQQTLTQATREHGPRSGLVARTHVALAAAHDYLGQTDLMRRHAELADSVSMEAVGATHPMRVDVLSAVGVAAYHDRRTADAVLAFERALQLVRHIKPADSIAVALAEHNLADALHQDGQDERAEALLSHAIPVLEQQLGAGDPRLADARGLRALVRDEQARENGP